MEAQELINRWIEIEDRIIKLYRDLRSCRHDPIEDYTKRITMNSLNNICFELLKVINSKC